MQITDEMVEAALRGWCGYGPDADLSKYQQAPETKEAWRRALEAALGQFMLQYGDNIELQEAEQIGFKRSSACIEELAAALKEIIGLADVDADNRSTISRIALEKWGLR